LYVTCIVVPAGMLDATVPSSCLRNALASSIWLKLTTIDVPYAQAVVVVPYRAQRVRNGGRAGVVRE
jgi:hypothetical protein